MDGTASRKRGWLVFGLCTIGIFEIAVIGAVSSDTQRWLYPFLGLLAAVQLVAIMQPLQDAGCSGSWAVLTDVATWRDGRYWRPVE